MDYDLRRTIWRRLISGELFDAHELPRSNGLVDLRGFKVPDPSVIGEYDTAKANVKQLGNLVHIRGAHWAGIDFSESRLNSLRFYGCKIENCIFDNADCQDWRIWRTNISKCSFRSTDLRRSALGGVDAGERNSFQKIDFTKADLRQTAHQSADFVDCIFSDTNLAKVDFWGTVFLNCIFEGRLDEVIFHRYAFRGEMYPPNEMKGVDFRRARFRFVEFRGLDMTDVKWPEDNDCIVIGNYTETLKQVLQSLKAKADVRSRKLAAIIESDLKWAGPKQTEGVVSKRDLNEVGGEWAIDEFLKFVGSE